MDRLYVINTLMRKKGLRRYLEIGVRNGHIFFRVRSTFKIAVDPYFAFDGIRKFGKTLLNPFNVYNRYFEETSDTFFEQHAGGAIGAGKIDLALVDGMHEYSFALRDIENTLRFLDDRGVIVVHDCNPDEEAATVSYKDWEARGFTGVWNGDVWKAIVHLRSLRRDVNAFVLDTDHGLGIITRTPMEAPLSLSPSEIAGLRYRDLEAHRKEWLNLKEPEFFASYFGLDSEERQH